MAGVVALNDREVRDFVRREYAEYDAGYAQLLAGLLEISDREPVDGVSVERLASVMLTAVDGAVLRLRFVPELGGAHVSNLVLGLWAGLTRPRGQVDDVLERRIAGPLTGSLSDDEQELVAAAVRRLNNRAGWGAVSLSKVANLSGVPVARVASVYPDHDHLSAVVWSDLAAGLRRQAGATAPDGVVGLERVVADLAQMACSHRELTASFLVARLSDRAGTGDGDGPGTVIVTLEDIIDGALSAAGNRGAPTASTIVDAVLLRAARTEVNPEDLVADLLGGLRRSGQ